jgi:membrane protein
MALVDHIPERLRRTLRPLVPFARALDLWSEAGGMRMSAAMSFYGILSLAPLLLAIVGMLGWWMDRNTLEKGLLDQLGTVIGAQGTAAIAETLRSAQEPEQGIAASIVGFVVLLFGATGVFGELQNAFERLWYHGRGTPPKETFWRNVSMRLRGVGYILVFGFLLLITLVVSTVLSLFAGWAGQGLALELAVRTLNEVAGFAVGAALFLGLMRLSTGPKPRTRFLLVGACTGALLFTIGRQLLSIYLSSAAVVSAYGAAGSLIVLLMWIYFSSGVLLLGASAARALEEYVADQQGRAQAPEGKERRTGDRRKQDRRARPASAAAH